MRAVEVDEAVTRSAARPERPAVARADLLSPAGVLGMQRLAGNAATAFSVQRCGCGGQEDDAPVQRAGEEEAGEEEAGPEEESE